jgi:hypothetical protein
MGLVLPDWIRYAILRVNRFTGILERRGIITYQDRIRWRGPLYRKQILFEQEGNDRIGELISRGEPLMVARLGATELLCLRYYLEKRRAKNKTYSDKVRSYLSTYSGFFPVDDQSLDAFSQLFLDQLQELDVMAVWFNQYEHVISNTFCPNAELVDLTCLEPFWYTSPWSSRLAGKKVLVIHPFAESIRKQYAENRTLLFPSPDILPEFDLKTIAAVQSIAGAKVGFPTWFDAYRHMCDEMARIDFDICLIGAGAYGLPLAAFAKQLGRQAIHMGGVTQILFGIKGKRWEELYADSTALMFNEHWVRPLPSETPENSNSVEKGCYW